MQMNCNIGIPPKQTRHKQNTLDVMKRVDYVIQSSYRSDCIEHDANNNQSFLRLE